jgi:hypothetical protein
LLLLLLAAAVPLRAFAIGTPPDTQISNTASVKYSVSGVPMSTNSNTVVLIVDEIVDVSVVSDDPAPISVTSPDTNRPLTFTVTNIGNGTEPYRLTANSSLAGSSGNTIAGVDFNPAFVAIYLDNGSGTYEQSKDTLYVAGSNDPVLASGQGIRVYVVNNIPSGRSPGDKGASSLNATAVLELGSPNLGKPGAVFPGAGNGGVTAILGTNGGTSTAEGAYQVQVVSSTLQKTMISILDPEGGSLPVSGAVLTYALKLTVSPESGTGATTTTTVNSIVITDPIPANTTYVAGSITLDGVALTDAQDSDQGKYTGTGIEVDLGNVTAPSTHTIGLKVKIN